MAESLEQKLNNKSAIVGVIGLGYVGLPLIRAFIAGGYRTMGFDVDATKVERLLAGESYIGHIPSEWIADCIKSEKFIPTADMARMAEADCLLICVPTPLSDSRDPDLYYVEATAKQIAASLRPGQLVVLESTTYPGTTRDVVLPILAESGLKVGKDFYLAYSPEREDPGNPDFSASGIPKVVGGIDQQSSKLAQMLYGDAVVNIVPVSSCEVAEACKILENTYRSINIAMVNELKMLFDRIGLDVWEVIDAAKTKPFGFQAFYPGPGLGGHCIPIDPFYLSWVARKYGMATRFIELAGEINTSMPEYVIQRLTEALNDQGKAINGSKILVLGVAYKKDVDDPRESPSFVLMELLQKRKAKLSYNDPHVPSMPKMRHHDLPAMESVPLSEKSLGEYDCVLIATDHSAYDYNMIVKNAKLVIDTRNATKQVKTGREKIVKA
jgi:UDP-N-acetyl-D-glucosamine dehydrogenase